MYKTGYIYKTTNKIDGKVYIGKCQGEFRPSYFGSGLRLKRALKSHGRNNFNIEVICTLPEQSQLDEFEKFMISKYREIMGRDRIYNIQDGGEGGLGLRHSEESKNKMSRKRKGWTVHSVSHFREMAKKRGSPWNKGLTKKDHPKIMTMAKYKEGKIPHNFGKPMSEEQKKKLHLRMKGRHSSPATEFKSKKLMESTNAK